jgi:hypothetical protein
LCKELGIEDPEQWLEECPQRVFENWQAYDKLEPIGPNCEFMARVISLLYVIASQKIDFESVHNSVERIIPCFMPSDWIGQPKPEDASDNLKSIEEQMRRLYG